MLVMLWLAIFIAFPGGAPAAAQTPLVSPDPAAVEARSRDRAELESALDAKDFPRVLTLLERRCDAAPSLDCHGVGELYSDPDKIGFFMPRAQMRFDYPRAAAAFGRLCFAVGATEYEQACYRLLDLQRHYTLQAGQRARVEEILLARCRASVDERRDFACVGLVARGRKNQVSEEVARTADRIARERCDNPAKTISRHQAMVNCEILAGDLKDLAVDREVAMDRMALFTRACEQGDPDICRKVADAFRLAISFPADLPRAMKLYRYACDEGDMMSCTRLGSIYQAGDLGAADEDMARQFYDQACRRAESDTSAEGALEGCVLLRHLGEASLRGLSLYRHWERRIATERLGCDKGRAESCVWLGDFFTEADPADPYVITFDYHQSNAAYKRACDAGDARACAGIGRNLTYGRGVENGEEFARPYLTRACKKRYVPACAVLGLSSQLEIWKNLDGRMLKKLRSDCRRNTASSARSCLVMVEYHQDIAERGGSSEGILKYALLGCRRGESRNCHTAAGHYLGEKYIDHVKRDRSAPTDVRHGMTIDEKACAQYHAPSCARLGAVYAGEWKINAGKGGKGGSAPVPIDMVRAQGYYEKALLLGEAGEGDSVRYGVHQILLLPPARNSRSDAQGQ